MAPPVIDTLIFVDVDGVVNVGLRDDDVAAPLLLSESSVEMVHGYLATDPAGGPHLDNCAKILSGRERLADAVSPGSTELAPLLLARLARIVEAAGPRCSVVLASSWRHPRHAARVERLERMLSERLGRDFAFHARTALVKEAGPGDRLRCIGAHVARQRGAGRLRVLILEDFFVSKLEGWAPGSHHPGIRSAADVEAYVQRCAPEGAEVSAKLLHCYDEWTTPCGVHVQAGAGLSEEGVGAAELFFAHAAPSVAKWPAQLSAERARQAVATFAVCWAGLLSSAPLMCLHV